ncbi:MAG: PIN domain-containing protein [Solirubrobacterales bacterium]|nr:PIN domain-containing protein [Solirubrobacterales bacterium]
MPLIVEEPVSPTVARLLGDDREAAAWWGARIECVSALRRREREGALTAAEVAAAVDLLDTLAATWFEVLPGDELRAGAERALGVHPLRAADALQLAAALAWRGSATSAADLVCLDERLREAAAREGFRVLPAKA